MRGPFPRMRGRGGVSRRGVLGEPARPLRPSGRGRAPGRPGRLASWARSGPLPQGAVSAAGVDGGPAEGNGYGGLAAATLDARRALLADLPSYGARGGAPRSVPFARAGRGRSPRVASAGA